MNDFNDVSPLIQMLKQLLVYKAKLRFAIVEDTIHSIFSSALTVEDYGVALFGRDFPFRMEVCSTGNNHYLMLPNPWVRHLWVETKIKAMKLKESYVSGRVDDACNAEYRHLFQVCDEVLERQTGIFALSGTSTEILLRISVSAFIAKQQENICFLPDNLRDMGFDLFAQTRESECPLMCPVKLEQRDHLRAFLMAHRIYCAVHWPVTGTPLALMPEISELSRELSLPIDQRYSRDELMYLVDSIRQYKEI